MRHLIGYTAIAVTLLAACGDTEAPDAARSSFDAVEVSTNLETAQLALANEAWQSLRGLGPRFGRIAGGFTLAGQARIVAPQLPPAVRGTTFVIDSASLEYVADPSRAGAPGNGVRFMLYAIDPSTQQPLPGREIGYADLTDEGSPAGPGIALRLRVVTGGITRLEYGVAVVGTDSAATLQAAGFTTTGASRVEFRVGVVGMRAADTTANEVQFAIGIPSKAFHATATLQHAALSGDSAGAIALNVRQGFNQVGMLAHATPSQIEAVFQINGIPFATAQGDPGHPDVRGADGRDLTPAEAHALIGIHLLVGRVAEMFDGLMRPVGGMLAVGAGQPT